MARTDDERAHSAWLDRQYVDRRTRVFREIEREVLGCDYGGTSWTDREEAEDLAARLRLGAGKRALEVGAGTGWPGLYLAARSGFEAVLADLPREGLREARRRAAADGLGGRAAPVVAEGAALPFADASFDAVYHCDVLC